MTSVYLDHIVPQLRAMTRDIEEKKFVVTRLDELDRKLSEIAQRLRNMESGASSRRTPEEIFGESEGVVALANKAIRRMAEAVTQSKILEAYLELAGNWVSRSALFLRREDLLVAWRTSGFERSNLKKIPLNGEGGEPSLLVRAAQERTIFYAEGSATRDFGWDVEGTPEAVVCIPLVFGQEVPVVFYGDAKKRFSTAGLEVLSPMATLIIQNNGLRVANNRLRSVKDSLEGARSDLDDTGIQMRNKNLEGVDVEAGSRRLGSDGQWKGMEQAEEGSRRIHEDHREDGIRFARLLVSEIRLHNIELVRQGRVEGDVYKRLREQIERGREIYERRVHPAVRAKKDFFDIEVLRILAGGERSLLGEEYPGPASVKSQLKKDS